MAELLIKGLGKAYAGRAVLHDVDLSVPSGALVAILGASGSGKTTLLRLICGFERPDAGTITVDGATIAGPATHVQPERRRIGYVAQDGALFPHLSVGDNVLFGLPRAERKSHVRAAELLELVGLSAAFAPRPPHQLSGGEQQRVALARALATRPRLVLMDEPFSALDAALRQETRQAVAEALRKTGSTALLVTHDQPEALSLGDPVAVLRDGRLVQVSAPRQLYHTPRDGELARFLGDAVVIRGEARDRTVSCPLGSFPLPAGMPQGTVDVLIRPEQIRLVPFRYGAGVRARVLDVSFFGPEANVRLAAEGMAPPVRFTARVVGHRAPVAGDEVSVVVEGELVTFPPGGR
jgi:iron(III) transport system ATP-binding protein